MNGEKITVVVHQQAEKGDPQSKKDPLPRPAGRKPTEGSKTETSERESEKRLTKDTGEYHTEQGLEKGMAGRRQEGQEQSLESSLKGPGPRGRKQNLQPGKGGPQPEAGREKREGDPLINSYQDNFRNQRDKYTKTCKEKSIIIVLRFLFMTAGYAELNPCIIVYSSWLVLLSIFQLAYDMLTVFGCPYFDCRFIAKHKTNKHNPTRKAQNVMYTLASSGGLFSYLFMVATLYYFVRKKRRNALKLDAVCKDVFKKRLCLLAVLLLILCLCYAASVSIFYYIVRDQFSLKKDFILLATGVGSQLAIQWTGIIACFVFGAIALSIGTFARDVQKRIKGKICVDINSYIIIHREFAKIVGDTVSAFSLWFVFHWVLYGLTTIMALLVIVQHFGEEKTVIKQTYVCLFFIVHVFMFVFPCAAAAYITSTCGSVPAKLNNTTKEDWPEGHLFEDREKLQLFIAYARESSVGFKIGRVTFTSTLAWVSLFLGSSGLLFRFF